MGALAQLAPTHFPQRFLYVDTAIQVAWMDSQAGPDGLAARIGSRPGWAREVARMGSLNLKKNAGPDGLAKQFGIRYDGLAHMRPGWACRLVRMGLLAKSWVALAGLGHGQPGPS